jgi:ABC-type transporter Mla subunit MlaD
MTDIHGIKERLESAQSNIESASWDADQAADNARDAVRNVDQALEVVSGVIDDLDNILGYSKHDVEQAMRHINYVTKLQALFINRLDNLIEGNSEYDNKMKFVNLIAFLETLTSYDNGQLSWDETYKIEAYYENSTYGYKTVRSEEVTNV